MRKLMAIIGLGLSVSLCQVASATTWYVDVSVSEPGDGTSWQTAFQKIQEGINAASPADAVIVAQGTYIEKIRFNGKNIILRSTDPLDPDIVAKTIIDGNQAGSVVTFSGDEDESCVLSGFTIRNGLFPTGGGICGGTWDNHTHATIQNNTVTGNSAGRSGPIGGGGLAFCDGLVRNNLVTKNSSEKANSGGGLYHCDGAIENNVISENSAYTGAGLAYCDGTIDNNVISENSAYTGAGLSSCDGAILSNTIWGNSAEWSGGGLYFSRGTITDCIIWANTSPHGPQLYDSTAPTYSCIQDWTVAGEGNLTLNPHFVDVESGDFHLRSWSPCIDAGDPACDFSNEPQPNGGRVNMGAYGNTPEATSKSFDTDSDSLPDDWELHWFGHLEQERGGDPDGDCIPNITEYLYARSPISAEEGRVNNVTKDTWYPTIQDALSGCHEGDEVVVHPGVYPENIQFNGKNIVLRSTDPLDPAVVEKTTIDGNQSGSVVTFSGTENETCVLSGFTIRNGTRVNGGGICGGMDDDETHATIQNNTISDNSAGSKGGGLSGCSGMIQNNTISDNSATYGGGLAYCDGTIQNNTIAGNSARKDGGGLSYCDGTIQNNIISRNTGGGLYSCDGVIKNNVISRNARGPNPMSGLRGCNGTIKNNIIYLNCGKYGGGLRDCHGTIENNTIAYNWAYREGGGLYDCSTVRNCIIWGNTAPSGPQLFMCGANYSFIQEWQGAGPPYFVDRLAGNYHLHTWSACIDAGDPSSDFSNEPQPNGARINMGAYGNTPEATSASADTDRDLLPDDWEMHFFGDLRQEPFDDPDGDGVSNLEEYRTGTNPASFYHVDPSVSPSGDGSSWETALNTIQQAIDAVPKRGAILVAQGIYLENINLDGKNVILRSTDPADPVVVANTIIDGSQSGPVVTFKGTENQACLLAGLTIRNGSATNGGGICGNGTNATIRNNTITGNSAESNGGGLHGCHGTVQNNVITGNWANYGAGLYGCHGAIQNNTIADNSARYGSGLARCDGTIENNAIADNSARYGAGIARCDGRIENNAIANNSADMYGGGIARCHGTIRNNTITWNSAGMYGGGLYGCDGAIQSNRITANFADYRGGGLDDCLATIRNNIIAGNWATWLGAGLYACDGTIQNNTIVANSAGYAGGGLDYCGGPIHNCIIWANRAIHGAQLYDSSRPTHSCIQDLAEDGEGNIPEDPRFIDPENGDFRLSSSSPCIDAGDNSAPDLPDTDIRGMHRIMYGGKSLTVDMGAYEYYINRIKLDANSDIILTWSSLSGKTYAIHFSTDMMTWEFAADNVPSVGDAVTTWLDPTAPLLSPEVHKRYYRVEENQ